MAAREGGPTRAAAATVDYFSLVRAAWRTSRSSDPNSQCLTRPRAGPQSSPQIDPPPNTVDHGIPEEERDRDRRKNTRVGEPPGDRIETKGRGRGRERAWHTRVTARQRLRGRSEKNWQDPQRDGGWEERQAWEAARGGETGIAERRAEGTRRARPGGHSKKQKKIKVRQDTKEGQTEGAGARGRRGKQGANKGAKVHIVSLRETPCR